VSTEPTLPDSFAGIALGEPIVPQDAAERWRAALAADAPAWGDVVDPDEPTGSLDPADGDRVWCTPEDIEVKRLYTDADTADLDFLDTYPGAVPYLRGPYPTMYVNQPWTVRQYAGFSTAQESNAFYRRNLAGGQKGLSVAFDLPTHRGYDSDHPRVGGDVGMAGVAIDSILDMRQLFDGIPLDQMSVSMTMNGAVLPVMALYVVAAEEQGVAPEQLAGTIQNDILKEFMVRNTYIYPPEPSMRIISDIFTYTSQQMPAVQLDLDLRLPHPGGRGDGRPGARVHAGRRRRVPAGRAGRRPGHRRVRAPAQLLLGDRHELLHGGRQDARGPAAVGQAGRRLRAANDKSLSLRTHSQTSGWSLTAQDVYNNVVRTCVEAMAATQGHTQSLHTNALDEALALPTDFSARIARNTQLLLQQESGTTRVIDPWGGSHYVERLTYELAKKAWAHFEEVEAAGGMAKAIEAGIPSSGRGGGRPYAGEDRLRPPAGDRGQQVPRRRRRADRRAEGGQPFRARVAASEAA
jgi:methylmalonyl-CoA mutase